MCDHFVVTFSISTLAGYNDYVTCPHCIYNFSQADYDGLLSYLLQYDFTSVYNCSDIESAYLEFSTIIHQAIDRFVPSVTTRRCKSPKWFTPEIRHLKNCLCTARKRCNKQTVPSNKCFQLESVLQGKMLDAKVKFEADLISDFSRTNKNKIYDYIKSLHKSSGLPPVLTYNDITAISDADKSSVFNQFFHSVFTISSFVLPDAIVTPTTVLSDIDISVSDVYNVLINLDPTKAMGVDRIGPGILKHCAQALCVPLHYLFSFSLCNQCIPPIWKIHKITPVFKSGDKHSVANYRPISLLCSVSKVLERLIYDKIIDFVLPKISVAQFGFLRNRSCLQQLLLFLHNIHKAFDSKSWLDAVYLDISKAFDSVPHMELLYKLRLFGITGNLWGWFQQYLLGRYHCVGINNHLSDYLPVLSGVPQGSILGPLLFVIYINDLPQSIKDSLVFLFADDAKCFRQISSSFDSFLLQSDIHHLEAWKDAWSLKFNVKKSLVVQFSAKPLASESNYFLDNQCLHNSSVHNDLGIFMNSDLSWSEHYSFIISKAYRELSVLRRSFNPLNSSSTKKTLYTTMVRSHLIYCSPVWRPRFIKDIQLLERVQRRATKYILNDFTSDYKDRLISLELLPLMMFYELLDIMFFVKSLKTPNDCFNISNYLQFTTRNTRSSNI